jgi:hypothetical protein
MMLKDRLNRIKRTSAGAKTLDQLLPDADITAGRAEIAIAKNSGAMSLSFRDIGDQPPVVTPYKTVAHA